MRLTKRDDVMVWFASQSHEGLWLEPCEMNSHDNRTAIDKLAEYEDAEEQGRLLILPCKVGDTVYRIWKTAGRKPEITAHYMDDLQHVVSWAYMFGKTVFLRREDAEAALEHVMAID